MIRNLFFIALSGLLWWGCSSHRTLAEQRIQRAESAELWVEKTVTDSVSLDPARESLTEAKRHASKSNYNNARMNADISFLESRLVMAGTTRDSVARQDSLLAVMLSKDAERKELYRQTLKNELQEEGKK